MGKRNYLETYRLTTKEEKYVEVCRSFNKRESSTKRRANKENVN